MESLLDYTKRTNQKMIDSGRYERVHLRQDYDDSTLAQNRHTISTQIVEAIRSRENNKIFGKLEVKTIKTDLVLNYKKTKSTKESHENKVQKLISKLGITILSKGRSQ